MWMKHSSGIVSASYKCNMTVLSVLLRLRRSVVEDGRGGGNVTSCQMSGKEPGVEHVIVDTSENKEGLRV